MKHAGQKALATLEPVLDALRKHATLVEKTPGTFYLRSKAFLHFHENAAGLFADVKENLVSFTRYRVSTHTEQKKLLALVTQCLNGLTARTTTQGKRRVIQR